MLADIPAKRKSSRRVGSHGMIASCEQKIGNYLLQLSYFVPSIVYNFQFLSLLQTFYIT